MDVYRSLTAECMECPHCTGYPCIDGCVKDWIDENVQKAAGVPGEWYQDDYIGGYYDDAGNLEVCEEYGSDEDFDTYSVEVQNGDGYYDSAGRFVRYRVYD